MCGVCRRTICDTHDAEDAFQATFLVLARKASSVVPREAVGNWLFGVAVHTSQRVRAVNARRSGREKSGLGIRRFNTEPADATQEREALAMLDEELSRLPEKYRMPLVLCDLEGRSRREVSRQLKLPEGTLSSRLATARKRLAGRLERRGVALSAGALTTVLSRTASAAGLPGTLAVSTSKAAIVCATTGQVVAGSVPARVAALTGAVMKAMFLTKLRLTTAVLVTLGAIFGLLAHQTWAAHTPEQNNRLANTPRTKDAAVSQLGADQPNPPKPGEMPPVKPDPPKPTIWREKATARTREVDTLAFAPDGRTLVCVQGFRGSGRAYGISILDATTLKELHSFKHSPGTAQFVGFGPDGTALALRGVGNKDLKNELEFKEAELIELATGKRRAVVDHGYWNDARLSPDGKTLVAARLGQVRLFGATTGKALDRFHGTAVAERLAFSDGNTLVVFGIPSHYVAQHNPHDLTVYDLANRKVLGSYNSADADAGKYAQAFRLSAPPAGVNKRVIEYLGALKPRGGEELSPYTSALTRDGKTLALNWRPQQHLPTEQQRPARVQIIDLDSGKEITSIPAPGGATAVAFSADGTRLVVGASGVLLWESATDALPDKSHVK